MQKMLHEYKNEELSDHDAGEHGYRVHCSIADGGIVAGYCVVGIIQRHRICHGSAKHSAGRAEIKFGKS